MISNFLQNDMFVVLFCYYFVVLFFDIIKGGCNVNRPMLSGHQGEGLKIIKTGLWVTKKMVTARSIDGCLVATNVTRLGVLVSTAVPSKKRDDHRLIFSLQHRFQERAVPHTAFFPPAFHNWGLTYTYLLSKTD